jgi:hypothetical protein
MTWPLHDAAARSFRPLNLLAPGHAFSTRDSG